MSVVVHKKPMMSMSLAWKIADQLGEGSVLVEWGGGGSTFFWLESTPVAEVHTIEHDRDWYRVLVEKQGEVTKSIASRLSLSHIPRYSTGKQEHHESPCGAEEYASPLEWIPVDRADVILVDGINRNLCLAFASSRAKRGAFLFLHDSEDLVYSWSMRFMRDHPDWREVVVGARGNPEEDYASCELSCWERIG